MFPELLHLYETFIVNIPLCKSDIMQNDSLLFALAMPLDRQIHFVNIIFYELIVLG